MENPASSDTATLVHSLDATPMTSKSKKPFLRKLLLILGVLIVSLIVLGFFFIYQPAKRVISSINSLESSGRLLATAVKSQDLSQSQKQLSDIKNDIGELNNNLHGFAWTNILPWVGNYYKDGQHAVTAANEIVSAGEITIDAIMPYADIIGFKGISGTGDGAKTAEDRINFIVNTLDKLKPSLGDIGKHLEVARREVDQIDPQRYPQEYKGRKIRSQLTQGITVLDQASTLVNDAKPLLENAPYMLGLDAPRKYLLILENDAELRPTGGFMTAYAVLEVNKGKIKTLQSDDIYTLDAKFNSRIPAPAPIKKYLPNVPYWYLRDQNLSPDFKVSMDTFYPNYQKTGSPAVDGIISVNTQVLIDLLKITGPIGVPGFGNFSAADDKRCNCPQVFYELELFADVEGPVVWDTITGKIVSKPKNYGERKSFIGPMMYSILSNVMAQPKSKMADMFNTGMDLIAKKHIQFYFVNPDVQQAVETFNMAGRIRDYQGDYLMVVDTNFAGAKTNAWVTYDAAQKIEISGSGTVTKTLTLTYKNPQHFFEDAATKLKLNGVFRDWLRVYVPQGSKLLEAKGFETGQITYDESGKTVFEGFFTLTPLNTRVISFKYELPEKTKSPLKMLIQKQAGTKDFSFITTINNKKLPELILNSDKELSLSY